MLRLMESLVYENQEAVARRVDQMAKQYATSLAALSSEQLPAKKDEVKNVRDAFKYLGKFKILPSNYEPYLALEKLIKEQGWDKKKSS